MERILFRSLKIVKLLFILSMFHKLFIFCFFPYLFLHSLKFSSFFLNSNQSEFHLFFLPPPFLFCSESVSCSYVHNHSTINRPFCFFKFSLSLFIFCSWFSISFSFSHTVEKQLYTRTEVSITYEREREWENENSWQMHNRSSILFAWFPVS